ncbi:MAG: CDP-glycerol glycerophosphotransferase family protein [Oscillospiraceae bacterium]|nr:CDP-glycerol glycerophosphotransferase family protein [Oscillospiraceae bacterium]MBP3209847.1 CDP-glycerol glycerophosphotransferase family protein [Oscillospiraceae bacterium]
MFLYIDPGTGSMLFTILIGVLSAAIYAFRGVWVKLKFLLSGGNSKHNDDAPIPFVFFTDSKRYWSIFKPLCDEMERRGEQVLYLTAEPDDPLLDEEYHNIRAEYAGAGNKTFARMNMLKADVVLSSTPGLDVYQWKRSRDVKWYTHVFHAANDVTLYRMFGIDYYDALLLSGEYQIREIRELEALRHLPEKELRLAGLPHMDALRERLMNTAPVPEHETTVLLAPSWGPSGILSKYGSRIIDRLLGTGFHVIIRPHPQSFISEREMLDSLIGKYPESEQLQWDRSIDNFDVLHRSDILISDFSGVIFDYTLVFDKPIIYADTSFDDGMYDAWWLEDGLWTFSILDQLGLQLTEENMEDIRSLIQQCLSENRFKEGRDRARAETWANIGHSVEAIADYLVEKRSELLSSENNRRAA